MIPYVSITVVEAQGETTGAELRFDGVLLALPPREGDDLGVVLPGLLAQDGRDEEPQVCSHGQP